MAQNAENPVTQMPKAAVKGPSGYLADVTSANELKVALSGSIVIPTQTVSEGPTGAPVPADATLIGGKDGSGDLIAASVDSSGNLNVNIVSGGGSNASVGTTGSTAPTSATEIGGIDASGNLRAPTVSVKTNSKAMSVEIVDANGDQITSFGSSTVTANQGTASAGAKWSVQVDNASAIPVSEATIDSTIVTQGTSAPTKVQIIGGKSNDGTPQYKELPLGAGARSVIVEGFAGGTAVKVDGSAVTQPVSQSGSSTANAPAATAVSNSSGSILASNANRKECMVVNTGTTVVFIALGQTPTTSAYHVALAPCTAANDGTGGVFISDIWTGAINAICAVSGTVVVTELT